MKIADMFELSYCINLDKRADRWKLCKKEFRKIDFYPERFSAIESPIPWFGCYQSHLAILKQAERENKNVFIFEDDVEIIENLDVVKKALDELATIPWDMFYLGGNILKPFYRETERLARLTHCQSTHAYGVNKDFLKSLITLVENNKFIIDVVYAEGAVSNCNAFITVPMVAIQRADYSNIEKTIMDYSVPMDRYKNFLRKGKFDEQK